MNLLEQSPSIPDSRKSNPPATFPQGWKLRPLCGVDPFSCNCVSPFLEGEPSCAARLPPLPSSSLFPVHQGITEARALCSSHTSPSGRLLQALAVTLAGVKRPSCIIGAMRPQHLARRAFLHLLSIITSKEGISYFYSQCFCDTIYMGMSSHTDQFSNSLDTNWASCNSVQF